MKRFDKKTLQGTVQQSNLESETLVESFSLLNTRWLFFKQAVLYCTVYLQKFCAVQQQIVS